MEENQTKEYYCHMLNVRLTDEENVRFQRLAEGLETTRSRFLRKLIREAINAGPDLLTKEWKLFEDLAYQLAAVGRNLNQLLKAVHTGKIAITPEDRTLVEAVRSQVQRVDKEVVSVIDRSCNRWVRDAAS